MGDGTGVWRRRLVRSFKTWEPTGPNWCGLASILKSFEQVLIDAHHPVLAFLTGSGSQTECDVTHSKQTIAQFLTGARMHIKESECCSISRCFIHPDWKPRPRISASNSPLACARFFPRIK